MEELAERRLFTREEIIAQGKRLQEMGAKNVLISLAAEGAILLTAEGEILFGEAPRGKLVNAVGAGDSMVGGFVAGWVKTGNYCEALQWGVAAGSASAFCETLATGEEIRRLYDRNHQYHSMRNVKKGVFSMRILELLQKESIALGRKPQDKADAHRADGGAAG